MKNHRILNLLFTQIQKVKTTGILAALITASILPVFAGPGKVVEKTLSMEVTETIQFPLTILLFDEAGSPYIPFTTTATAKARHLGKSNFSSVGRYYLGPFGPAYVTSVGELTAASGDVIPFDFAEDLLNTAENDGVLILSGGTGRFEKAVGFLQWDVGMETEGMQTVDESGAPILLIINQGTMSGIIKY